MNRAVLASLTFFIFTSVLTASCISPTIPQTASTTVDAGTDMVTSYLTTFNESGLPANTTWSVNVNGLVANSTSSQIMFSTVNGTYPYSIPDVTVYIPNPVSGTFTVSGRNMIINVTFNTSRGSLSGFDLQIWDAIWGPVVKMTHYLENNVTGVLFNATIANFTSVMQVFTGGITVWGIYGPIIAIAVLMLTLAATYSALAMGDAAKDVLDVGDG